MPHHKGIFPVKGVAVSLSGVDGNGKLRYPPLETDVYCSARQQQLGVRVPLTKVLSGTGEYSFEEEREREIAAGIHSTDSSKWCAGVN